MRPLVVAIHGILTGQTDASWPDRLVADCLSRDVPALKREYVAGPFPHLNVWWKNPRHAEALANEIRLFDGVRSGEWALHFVGHSNGCDIALQTVRMLADLNIRVQSLILTASVTHPDVLSSGVLGLVMSGRLRRAVAYCSDGDLPLRIPTLLKWPYRDLGRKGWLRDGSRYQLGTSIYTRWFPGYGHGDYFASGNREATFRLFREDMELTQ